MSKLVVTGGAGFIGSHIVDKLIESGHQVVVIDNLMLGKKSFVNKKAKFVKADIRDIKKLQKYFVGAEAVFHLAADPRLQVSVEDPVATHEINVTGTINVLEAARKTGVKKVIFSSSCAVYGDAAVLPINENTAPNPLSPYGLHKLMGEQYCRLYSNLFGLETVCLRYFNVFGPRKLATGSYPMVIPVFLDQRQRGKSMTVVGDGTATRDYVYVSDVANANMLAWKSNVKDGSPINIGTGVQVSVNQIAKLIGGPVINLPPRAGEMKKIQADNIKAKQLLGWVPTVKFEDGLKELKKEWKVE